jgi:hypothetical protein
MWTHQIETLGNCISFCLWNQFSLSHTHMIHIHTHNLKMPPYSDGARGGPVAHTRPSLIKKFVKNVLKKKLLNFMQLTIFY